MRFLAAFVCLILASSAWADHRVVVQIAAPTARAQTSALRVLAGHDYTVTRTYKRLPYMAVTVDDHGLEALEDAVGIVGVVPDYEFDTMLGSSVPLIGADKVHASGFLGAGWAVAVLDTGLDLTHSSIATRIVAEACFTTGNQCPNGQSTMIGKGAAAAIADHGTHVAGICCGFDSTIVGVAPRSSIIGVQVFTRRSSGGISASFSDIIAGIEWVAGVAENGTPDHPELAGRVASINMSLGTGPVTGDCTSTYQAIADASALAIAAGVGVISAAGNNGSSTGISSPGCIRNNVAVGCTSKTTPESVCSFSNKGPEMDLWAPGLSIVSARQGGGSSSKSGTSMSTPHVAGAYALVNEMFQGSSITPDNIRTMLKFFGTDVAGRPRLRVDNITPTPPDPNEPEPPEPPDPNGPRCDPDSDGDGEIDRRDRCPDTPRGDAIDDAGCSWRQWCSTIVPGTWREKGDCRKLDWENNEPRNALDCKIDRRGWGSGDDVCVPK